MSWKQYLLEDHIKIKHGYAFKGEFFSDTPTDDILLTPGNFNIGGGFKSNKFKYYNGEYPDSYILNEGDVIVTMTDLSKEADTLGYSVKVPFIEGKRLLHNQRIGLVQLKTDELDLNYLYWLLRTYNYQKFVANGATGATVKHTSPTKICLFSFTAPTKKETQKRIASILSYYDDLIENNSKRINLLEELLKINFEELQNQNANELRETRLLDICYITDGTHDSPKQKENGIYLITGKHLNGGFIDFSSAYKISEEDHNQIKKRSGLTNGDIIFSNIGTIGNVAIIDSDFEFSVKNVIIFKPISLDYSSIIYCYLQSNKMQNTFLNESYGTSQKFISLKYARDLKINLPKNDDELIAFTRNAQSLIKMKSILNKQNHKLKEARDILLPRLMNGEIKV